MDDIIRPKINLKEQQTIKCEKCESKFFKEVTMLKKVPFPTYMCNDCGHVNSDFELFID